MKFICQRQQRETNLVVGDIKIEWYLNEKKNIFLRIVNILVLIFFKATPNYDTISKIPDARILK